MGARASWTATVLLGVLTGLGAVALSDLTGSAHPELGSPRPVAAPARTEVLDVLHGWDRRRARAWAAGDPAALRDLYVAGSRAGQADAQLLRRYVARGLVVRRMAMQVFAVRVVESDAHRIRLVVTDRLAAGEAVAGDRAVQLPGDAASTRSLLLRRVAGQWRMAAVRSPGAAGR